MGVIVQGMRDDGTPASQARQQIAALSRGIKITFTQPLSITASVAELSLLCLHRAV
jgi:hypothetical protein